MSPPQEENRLRIRNSNADHSILAETQNRLLLKAEHLIDTMIGVGETMRKVADLELKIAKKLLPIVDDLGVLVRTSLAKNVSFQPEEPLVSRIKSANVNRPVTRGGTGDPTRGEINSRNSNKT